jgi:hypothetical protein
MTDIEFRWAWDGVDADMIRDAREFWANLEGLSPEQIDERTGELCAVA